MKKTKTDPAVKFKKLKRKYNKIVNLLATCWYWDWLGKPTSGINPYYETVEEISYLIGNDLIGKVGEKMVANYLKKHPGFEPSYPHRNLLK